MLSRLRYIPSTFAAMVVTTALFALMHLLVQYEVSNPGTSSTPFEFQFRQVIPDTEPEPPDRIKKPDLEKPDPPPPAPQDKAVEPVEPIRTPVSFKLDALPGFGNGPAVAICSPHCARNAGQGAGELVPIVRIEPPYPRRAALAGTEGWVRVSFTVTENGAVMDPRIEEAQPSRVFDQAVLRTIVKWKFRPQQTADGKPARVRAIQTLDFKL